MLSLSEKEIEILNAALASYDKGEEFYLIKMPPSNKIHELNMALNSLSSNGYIEFLKRSMTEIKIQITEKALEELL